METNGSAVADDGGPAFEEGRGASLYLSEEERSIIRDIDQQFDDDFDDQLLSEEEGQERVGVVFSGIRSGGVHQSLSFVDGDDAPENDDDNIDDDVGERERDTGTSNNNNDANRLTYTPMTNESTAVGESSEEAVEEEVEDDTIAAATATTSPPQHHEIVPFLTRAQIRELSVRIKNMAGEDERASRAIIKRLADSGVGVRITESLQGVEVYVDALTEEVKASRDSDERERECFLYRDKEGRLYNLVISGGANEIGLSWEESNRIYSGWLACIALPFLGRLFAYLINMGPADNVAHVSVFLLTVFGFVLNNEISHSWLNTSMHVLGTNSIGAYVWKSVIRTDQPRYAVLIILAMAVFAPVRDSARGVLLGVGGVCGFVLLLANLGARSWQKLNMDYMDADRYRPLGSIFALLAAAFVGLTFPYISMTSVVGGASKDKGAATSSRQRVAIASSVSAFVFSITGVEPISSGLGMTLYNKGTVNAAVGLWWMMSSLASLAACRRVQSSKYEQDEVVLERNEASPVGWCVPFISHIGLDPSKRQKAVFHKKLSRRTTLVSLLIVLATGSYFIWRGSHMVWSEEHAIWAATHRSYAAIQTPTNEPSDRPSMVPSVSQMPSTSPSHWPSLGPTRSMLPSASPSELPSSAPSDYPSHRPSSMPTVRPSASPSSSPTSSPTSHPTLTHSSDPSSSPSAYPTQTHSSSPSVLPTLSPSTSPSNEPSQRPSSSPSAAPTSSPTIDPSVTRSEYPSWQPSFVPTASPSDLPSDYPTSHPSTLPSDHPSIIPSQAPTTSPTISPSFSPTRRPTTSRTEYPSQKPTDEPTRSPSTSPSMPPTFSGSESPSSLPSYLPSASPSAAPTPRPSSSPSRYPTPVPTTPHPTTEPSDTPSSSPSVSPTTAHPTQTPTFNPTAPPTIPPPTTSPSSTPSNSPVTVVVESKIFDMTLSKVSNYMDVDGVSHLNDALNAITLSFLKLPNPEVTDIAFTTNLVSQELAGGFLRIRVHRAAHITVPANGGAGLYDPALIPDRGIFDLVMLSIFTTPSRKEEFLKGLQSGIREQKRGADQFEDVNYVVFLGFYIPPTAAPSPSPSLAPTEVASDYPSSRPSTRPSVGPSHAPSAHPTSYPTISPTMSAAPTAGPVTIVVQATTFDISLTFMSKPLDMVTTALFINALNNAVTKQFASMEETSIEFSTSLPSQDLSPPTLTLRVAMTASVTVPNLNGESRVYDESLVPSVSSIDEAMQRVFAKEDDLNNKFVGSLRKSAPTAFGYMIKAEWIGFYYPPTPFPSAMPSTTPSLSPSDQPSAAPTDVPSKEPSAMPTAMPSTPPSVSPTTKAPSDEPSSEPSSAPSFSPVTIVLRGHPFDISLRRMSTYMGVASLARFSDVLDDMILNNMDNVAPGATVKFSSLLLSQNLGSTSLRVRVQRTVHVTVPRTGEAGTYDAELVPTQEDIEWATTLALVAQKSIFIEKLHAAPIISQYRYLNDISFLGFKHPPTSRRTAMPFVAPTASPMETSMPTSMPSKQLSALPSAMPTVKLSGTPSVHPTHLPTSAVPTKMPLSYIPTTKPSMLKPTALQSSQSPTLSPTTSEPTSFPSSRNPTVYPTSPLSADTIAESESDGNTVEAVAGGPSANVNKKRITWAVSQSGQDADGGWVVNDDGLHLRFNVEASDFCYKGTNRNTQKGKAVTTIEVKDETKLFFVLGGEGESLDSGYEQMSLTIDRDLIATSTSNAIGEECASNPVLVTYYQPSPYTLTPGKHVLVVDFTTADDFDHYGTYWTIEFSFGSV